MKLQLLQLALVVIIACSFATRVPLYTVGEYKVANRYVFAFNDNITADYRQRVFTSIPSSIKSFEIGSFRGFTAELSERVVEKLREDTDTFKYVEEEAVFSVNYDEEEEIDATCIRQDNAVWGLDRVSSRTINAGPSRTYIYPDSAGKGVTAYVIDTGVYLENVEFEGRAVWGDNFADKENRDCQGHGTHVAGTIGGKKYGVAKKVNIVAVKVLGCDGRGTTTGVISGIEWAVNHYIKNGKKPSTANMSLGGGKSVVLNDAVTKAVEAGVVFGVAGGNDNGNACNYSPSSTEAAITVGATDIAGSGSQVRDERAYFSNYGPCLDIFAPGVKIESAWIGSPTATNTISGTSMATPHVVGVTALVLGEHPNWSAEQVKDFVLEDATKDIIELKCTSSICKESPNALLFSDC